MLRAERAGAATAGDHGKRQRHFFPRNASPTAEALVNVTILLFYNKKLVYDFRMLQGPTRHRIVLHIHNRKTVTSITNYCTTPCHVLP